MNTFNHQEQKSNGLEKVSLKEQEFTKITQAIFDLSKQPISREELFGHTTFAPHQEKAAGVLGLGRMYSLFSKKVYDEVMNPSLKYDRRD